MRAISAAATATTAFPAAAIATAASTAFPAVTAFAATIAAAATIATTVATTGNHFMPHGLADIFSIWPQPQQT